MLDALRHGHFSLDRAGEIPPASNHTPPHTKCVPETLWRDYCYQGGVSTGDQHAKGTAFRRAAEALLVAGRVGKWEPLVWLT